MIKKITIIFWLNILNTYDSMIQPLIKCWELANVLKINDKKPRVKILNKNAL